MNKKERQPLLWVAVATLAIVAFLMFIQGRLDEFEEKRRNEADRERMPRILTNDAYIVELKRRMDRIEQGESNSPPVSTESIIERYDETKDHSP